MPTNHKRQAPARTSNGPAASEPTAAAEPAAVAPEQPRPAPPPPRRDGLNITDLKDMSIQKLTQVAKDLNVSGATGTRNRS